MPGLKRWPTAVLGPQHAFIETIKLGTGTPNRSNFLKLYADELLAPQNYDL
jgi:hypothetical protein